MQKSFSYERFRTRLVLKLRQKRIRKWPIKVFTALEEICQKISMAVERLKEDARHVVSVWSRRFYFYLG